MRTKPSSQMLGFLELQLRAQWRDAKGQPLGPLEAVIGWEGFHSAVPAMHRRPDGVLLVAL